MKFRAKDSRLLLVLLSTTGNRGAKELIRHLRDAATLILLCVALIVILSPATARASTITVDDILVFFDAAVKDGRLIGSPENTELGRRQAMRNKIREAGRLVKDGKFLRACDFLLDALEHTDGRFPPQDFVAGPGAITLSDLILTLRLDLNCGVEVLPAGTGGTVNGPGGTSVTVAPGSVPYDSIVSIAPARSNAVIADNGPLPILAAVEVVFQPVGFLGIVPSPTVPLQISTPALFSLLDGTEFVVGQQALLPFADGIDAGLDQQFIAVASGQAQGGQLTSQSNIFPGIFGGGTFAFLEATGSGYATGVVRDAGPREGVVVSNNTNTLVAVTNGSGAYTLFISGGPFTVFGFDPFRGSGGFASGNIAVHGSTVTKDIALAQLTIPVNALDGIRNGGFERGDLTSWTKDSNASAASVLRELVCTGMTIRPTEGQWMADINTSQGAQGEVGSAITQRFKVPAGAQTLTFDFNYVSEEFPEFVGTQFQDSFRAVITRLDTGEVKFIKEVTVDSVGLAAKPIGDCGFPGGDNTAGMTDWITVNIPVSVFAGTGDAIQVELFFSANDLGDDIYDTHVLIDNIRFSTLWIDAKILQGPNISANADRARVENEVREANEILSEAGVNIQLRDVRTTENTLDALVNVTNTWSGDVNCPDGTGLPDGTGRLKGTLTPEESAVLRLLPTSTNLTDLNVYYVKSLSSGTQGFALGPDDFCLDVTISGVAGTDRAGTLQVDIGRGGKYLAHEIGHILISPKNYKSVLEHNADVSNFMNQNIPSIPVLNDDQSANINRNGAPLLLQ